MPISPIPPSARNTSSSPGDGLGALGDCSITLSSFARPPDRNLPVGQLALPCPCYRNMMSAPSSARSRNCAADFFPAGIDGQCFPGRAAALAPRLAYGAQNRYPNPRCQASVPWRRQDGPASPPRQHRHAVCGQMRGGRPESIGMPGQIDADAHHRRRALRLGAADVWLSGRMPAHFASADQDVIGPLQAQIGKCHAGGGRANGIDHGHPGQQ